MAMITHTGHPRLAASAAAGSLEALLRSLHTRIGAAPRAEVLELGHLALRAHGPADPAELRAAEQDWILLVAAHTDATAETQCESIWTAPQSAREAITPQGHPWPVRALVCESPAQVQCEHCHRIGAASSVGEAIGLLESDASAGAGPAGRLVCPWCSQAIHAAAPAAC